MQKVMESLDAETVAIAGKSLTAQAPVRVTAGAKDAAGMSVDTFAVVIQLTNADTNVNYNVQLDVMFDNASGTCDYIKKSTQVTIQ